MKCIYCETQNIEKANFCKSCRKQFKCLNCSEELEKENDICTVCGVETKVHKNVHNTIEFTEGENTRTFKASFSNEVGQSIGEAFGIIISSKRKNQSQINNILEEKIEDKTEDVEFSEIKTDSKNDKILSIFNNNNGGKITINETRLKAHSKRDYSIRLTLIYIYYKSIVNNDEKVLRTDLTAMMKDASVEDGNWRAWLGKNNLVGVHDDYVELKAPGRENAKQIISEIFDTNFEDKWKLGSSKPLKRGKKKEDDKAN